ncbi:hypothetical protein [Flavobacterium johnsoniae]|uniref:RiboL-PSP-HEPN domain-containing protein n=1 Tax=Flavobacterium johnsoniae (strain ATCC 17061 / DSM 2064 / JCM 8514 / BCRC 14874 / CCUG 350202 / NBRC 14942 / NCIMB 11054 / UW101) TaxID=376686 RepID=A5FDU6_FLAJ1|nr:hypothetical protein Fjoh_3600 [Flavobacterium johnsoniae UW101]OXE99851.1 hypothetical protein B0A63_11150 [Flavobacterium johnsoniae UW101]SHK81331.1 hypothetical protein SAMN05444146_2356 [Flavobacterium johnsoniae]
MISSRVRYNLGRRSRDSAKSIPKPADIKCRLKKKYKKINIGYWSDVHIAMGEREDEAHLAPKLGINYTELCQLDYTIETNESDEGLLYNYRIVFNHSNPHSILQKVKGLDKDLTVYLEPWEFDDRYDYDVEFEAITENNDYSKNFYDEIENLESLLTLEVPNLKLQDILYRQIFISIIGTLETYLASSFINRTFDSNENLKRFICSHPEFKNQKFEIREIFDKYDEIENIAQKVMLDTIYHNLPIVRNMYRDTFKINFPDFSEIYKSVLTRHDLVHRNGFTKGGNKFEIKKDDINQLMNNVKSFVRKLVTELEE